MSRAELLVGGLTPLTSIDFPGELAAVVFCQGCPWRCGYCQNGHLLGRSADAPIPWGEITRFLRRRTGLLDAVVFSGGEPLLQRRLLAAMREVRDLGFKIGLHTAGPYPQRLEEVLPLVDWVGMDLKGPPEAYQRITAVRDQGAAAWRSARLLIRSGIPHQFRTTVHPALLSPAQVRGMGRELARLGSRRLALQECITERCLDPALRQAPTSGYLGAYAT